MVSVKRDDQNLAVRNSLSDGLLIVSFVIALHSLAGCGKEEYLNVTMKFKFCFLFRVFSAHVSC